MSTSEHEPVLRMLREARAKLTTKLEQVDAAIAAIAVAFGETSVAVETAPRRHAAQKRPATPAPAPRAKGRGRQKIDREGLEGLILARLQKERAPITFAALLASCAGVSDFTLRPVLKALVERGAVVQSGATISRRLGLPAVMAAGAPAKEAVQRG